MKQEDLKKLRDFVKTEQEMLDRVRKQQPNNRALKKAYNHRENKFKQLEQLIEKHLQEDKSD